jgi:hypothetical protein
MDVLFDTEQGWDGSYRTIIYRSLFAPEIQALTSKLIFIHT